ncbi:hypothetical protein [Halorarum halobium]|uniref:hypothetical protein n=1 Tax=Halorarum halobium TaxID=3075121 RepID=UPI0028AD0B1D|nr:hypothetical protein [Halobaculum sp. XH14]
MTDANERMIERVDDDLWNGIRSETTDELVNGASVIHARNLAEELREKNIDALIPTSTRSRTCSAITGDCIWGHLAEIPTVGRGSEGRRTIRNYLDKLERYVV